MTISDIWDMVCALLNVRLAVIWALEMHLNGFI